MIVLSHVIKTLSNTDCTSIVRRAPLSWSLAAWWSDTCTPKRLSLSLVVEVSELRPQSCTMTKTNSYQPLKVLGTAQVTGLGWDAWTWACRTHGGLLVNCLKLQRTDQCYPGYSTAYFIPLACVFTIASRAENCRASLDSASMHMICLASYHTKSDVGGVNDPSDKRVN